MSDSNALVIVLAMVGAFQIATLFAMRSLARSMFMIEHRVGEMEDALLEDVSDECPPPRPHLTVVPITAS